MDQLLSPPSDAGHLKGGSSSDSEEEVLDDDLIKITLHFFSQSSLLLKKVFNDDWYLVVEKTFGTEFNKEFQPYLEVSSDSTSLRLFLF